MQPSPSTNTNTSTDQKKDEYQRMTSPSISSPSPSPSPSSSIQLKNLQAVAVIEKDFNNDLFSWTFPSIDSDMLEVIKSRSGLLDKDSESMSRYSKYKGSWHYSSVIIINNDNISVKFQKIHSVAVCIVSEIFNPAKYQQLIEIFQKQYLEHTPNSPLPILSSYLSVFTTGKTLTFHDSDFENKRAFISPVKEIFTLFGLDAILIWQAMLQKKRIFVYSNKLSDLLALVRSFPLLGSWHRQNFDLLRPFTGLTKVEIADLQSAGVYVAGVTDQKAVNYKELYDLFVDVPNHTCIIGENAKNDFIMTKYHKDLAEKFVKCAEEKKDHDVIKEIATQTKELISSLLALQTKYDDGTYITLEGLQEKKLAPNMDRFLFGIALAEGLCKN